MRDAITVPMWLYAHHEIDPTVKWWYLCLIDLAKRNNRNTFTLYPTAHQLEYGVPTYLMSNMLTVLSNYRLITFTRSMDEDTYEVTLIDR